jgi:hypothetical protein
MAAPSVPQELIRGEAPTRAARLAAWAPVLLAVFFSFSALRGVGSTNVVDTDGARHGMNGAFIYDLVRTGNLTRPIEYAKEYYGHLPALSMPFHPPLFPAIEAVFFAIFGVKYLTARVAVALAVGLAAILLYRLVVATHGSAALAACVTATTFALWTYQQVGKDIMLEYPAMVFTLAALTCLVGIDREYTLRRALLFAVLASAAVWTKQHAVFLGLVPPLYALMTRRWRLLFGKSLWVSSAIFGAAVFALQVFSNHFHGSRVDPNSVGATPRDLALIVRQNVNIYGAWIAQKVIGLSGIAVVVSVPLYGWAVYKRGWTKLNLGVYLAWIVAVSGILLVLGAVSPRYMFFMLPAVVMVFYRLLFAGCEALWGNRNAWRLPAIFALAWSISGWMDPPEFLRGPAEAAAAVVQGKPTRVVYAGEADGNFIFAVRSLDPRLEVSVIPAEKLSPATLEPAAFEHFCRRHGIEWLVIEDVPRPHKWSALTRDHLASMKLERSLPLQSNRPRWQGGDIKIYHFAASSEPPADVLRLPLDRIGGFVDMR